MNTTTTKSAKNLSTDCTLRSRANKNASSERRNVPCPTRFFTLEEINTRAETPLLNEILDFRLESQSTTGLADCRRAENQPANRLRRGVASTDNKLTEALVAQLNFWVGNSASKIQVTVKNGIVTLRGSVPNYAEKMACVELVQRVDGVTALVDEIIVELPEAMRRTDIEITAAVANAINWITTVPLEAIDLTVRGGKLLLEGAVEELQQKKLVELVVRQVPSITEITNLITTKRCQN